MKKNEKNKRMNKGIKNPFQQYKYKNTFDKMEKEKKIKILFQHLPIFFPPFINSLINCFVNFISLLIIFFIWIF